VKCAASASVPAVARSGGYSYGAYSLGGPSSFASSSHPSSHIPCEQSLVIDLAGFNRVSYDMYDQQAWTGSGATVGEMAEMVRVQEGRSIPIGMCPSVGVGGEALVGGHSSSSRWVHQAPIVPTPSQGLCPHTKLIPTIHRHRLYGLLSDHMVSADIALATGEIIRASEYNHPDLFWMSGVRAVLTPP
jgi:FAD/FMN-containing dehydrogenase